MGADCLWPLPPVERLIGRISIPRQSEPRNVRIPDSILKCVAFLATGSSSDFEKGVDEYDLLATGFFLSIRDSLMGHTHLNVFVTAKHVVKPLEGRKNIGIVINEKDGGRRFIRIFNQWVFHPTDETVDIAVHPIPLFGIPDGLKLDIRCPSTDSILTPSKIRSTDIGIGDEVFMPGLFEFVPGRKRSIPIVRHGNIAMLPDEAIQVGSGFAEVYLIEARSMKGLSGSPVFACRTLYGPEQIVEDGQTDRLRGLGRYFLLGVAQDHWDVGEVPSVNMGIAVIVPGHKILETIEHPEIVKWIELSKQKFAKAITPTQD